MSRCHDCDAQLTFVRLDTGKAMPVDPVPDPAGTVAASREAGRLVGHVVSAAKPLLEWQQLYMTHHATCHRQADRIARPAGLFDGADRG